MSYTLKLSVLNKTSAQVGDQLYPDQWPSPGNLIAPDSFDLQYFGGDILRVNTNQPVIPTLPVKVKITGRKAVYCWSFTPGKTTYKVRVKVEFVKDGEPSTFSGGWLFFQTER